jgi:hypothetical protein
MPVKAVVPKSEAVMAKAAAMDNMRGAIAAATEHRATLPEAAAVKDCPAPPVAASMEAATAMVSAATVATTASAVTAATVAAADLGGRPVGNVFGRRRRGWTDQRKRFRALA